MSRVTLAKPRRRPDLSCSAVRTTDAQKREPSLRTRSPSSVATPCFGRPPQQPARHAGDHILRKIEADKRLADDLVGAIALDALGTGVPRHDMSLGVEKEDRVVAHFVDQQTKLLLALAQHPLRLVPFGLTLLLGEAAFSQISGDFCKPNQGSRFIADRRDDDARPKPGTIFADSPVLFFISSFAQGCFQQPLRMAGLPCLFGIEDREVLADDFIAPCTP